MKFQLKLYSLKAKQLKSLILILLKSSTNKKKVQFNVSIIWTGLNNGQSQIRLFIDNQQSPTLIILCDQMIESQEIKSSEENNGIVLTLKQGRFFLQQFVKILQTSAQKIILNVKKQKPLTQDSIPFRYLRVSANLAIFKFEIEKPIPLFGGENNKICFHPWINGLSKCRIGFLINTAQFKDMLRMISKCVKHQLLSGEGSNVKGVINPVLSEMTLTFQDQEGGSFKTVSKIEVIKDQEFTDQNWETTAYNFTIKMDNARKLLDKLEPSQIRIYLGTDYEVAFVYFSENVYVGHVCVSTLFAFNGIGSKPIKNE